jgi:galactoside O-acetyltransferase
MRTLGGRYLTETDLANAGFKSLGRNVRVHERASLYGLENISLADDVRIDDFTIIIATGEVSIGRHVSIPNHCFLGGKFGLELQDFVTLAPGVKLFSASDDYSGEFMTGPTLPLALTGGRRGKVILERHVLLGAGVVVLPGCTLGEGVSVGALSLVKNDLSTWGIYGGVPCSFIRPRKKELLQLVSQLNHTPTA